MIRPKILQRETSGKDIYNPCVTSWLQLIFLDGKTILAPHHGDSTKFLPLLRVPSKGSFGFLSVSDILTNPSLKGHYVDLMAAVRSVCPVKTFPGKDGDQGRDLKGILSICLGMVDLHQSSTNLGVQSYYDGTQA